MVYTFTITQVMNFYLVFLACVMACMCSVCECKNRPTPTVVKHPIKHVVDITARVSGIQRRQDIVTSNSGIGLAETIKKSVQRSGKK
jgi:hypothetical protein